MGLLYHYTNLHTLCAIINGIKSGEMFLRAGNAQNMNDPNDCYYFINMLGDLTGANDGQIKQILEDKFKYDCPYLVSLSKHKDDLHMWNCYGDDGCGIAIGIKDVGDIVRDYFLNNKISAHLYECLYMDAEDVKEDDRLRGIINNTKNFNECFWKKKEISEVSNIIKHPCYRYEEEYRIVILHGSKEYIVNEKTFYHAKEDAFYINIPLSHVAEIIVGPCTDYNAVVHIFSQYFPQTEFIESKIPYRKK